MNGANALDPDGTAGKDARTAEALGIARELTGFPDLRAEDDWTALGVHSIVAVEVLVVLEDILGPTVWATAADGDISVAKLVADSSSS